MTNSSCQLIPQAVCDDDLSISVVMPLFNKEEQVARAIFSVLRQRASNFELIVVNDGSSDRSGAIAASFNDPRIQILSQDNAGVSAARNLGVIHAKAGLVAFLDADDEWHPTFLETILELAKAHPDCGVYATAYQIGAECHLHPAQIRGLRPGFTAGELENYFSVAANSDPPICSSSVAVRREALTSIGGFPVGASVGEDLLTWARLATQFKIAYSTQPLATFWQQGSDHIPRRAPPAIDHIGDELAALFERHGSDAPSGMSAYLAHWHRMRGAVFLRLADARSARLEFRKALSIARPTHRLLALFLLSLMPGRLARFIYGRTKSLLRWRKAR